VLPSTKRTVVPALRLRVFAGPNGSGKSTVINAVKQYTANGRPIDFGYYINADDIAAQLRENGCPFDQFDITVTNNAFASIAIDSGLINQDFTEAQFFKCYILRSNTIKLKVKGADERLAQIIADFLRKTLLLEKKRFSFETVFSHESKLDIMRKAADAGYKVYLYFVSTELPEINKYRVDLRVRKGGHYVDPLKIESRYYRSLELLYQACQLSYSVFFFDNSKDNEPFKMFANFKKNISGKKWERTADLPEWFKKYYLKKIKSPK